MILGITGISGSGKHTAAHYFKQKGWVILDADKIAHHSYRPYTNVWKAIVKEYGESILNQDDTINRVKLGKIVFGTSRPDKAEKALKRLSRIVHPYVKRRIKNRIHYHFRRQSDIVVLAALWEELCLKDICDKILLIKAPRRLMSRRIQQRDGISPKTYEMRVKNQTEPPQPDFIVENNGSLQDFRGKLDRLGL